MIGVIYYRFIHLFYLGFTYFLYLLIRLSSCPSNYNRGPDAECEPANKCIFQDFEFGGVNRVSGEESTSIG